MQSLCKQWFYGAFLEDRKACSRKADYELKMPVSKKMLGLG
jgi:hypothetical protein